MEGAPKACMEYSHSYYDYAYISLSFILVETFRGNGKDTPNWLNLDWFLVRWCWHILAHPSLRIINERLITIGGYTPFFLYPFEVNVML